MCGRAGNRGTRPRSHSRSKCKSGLPQTASTPGKLQCPRTPALGLCGKVRCDCCLCGRPLNALLLLFRPRVGACPPQVTSKQRQREAAAAAAGEDGEEGGEYEAEEPADLDDDLMGEGFSSFVARDEDNEAGFLYYEDELDGDIPQSSFLERDEAEEEGEEGAVSGADS